MLRILLGLLLAASIGSAANSASADVLVIGAGIAGLTTALEAARGGASVVVVDVASVFGGHAVVSEGGLSLVATPLQQRLGVKDSPDLAYADFLRWGGDANAVWVRLYVERSRRDVFDWMTELGVTFDALRLHSGNSASRFHLNSRRGYGLVEPIYRECLRSGKVRFYWNVRITELVRRLGRVTGVKGVNERSGASFQMSAEAVVLATGGYQSNLALVKNHWPPELVYPPKLLVGSGVNALGSGLDLGRRVEAVVERLDHQWNYPHGIPDPRYPGSNRGLSVVNPAAVWVNPNGERFANEEASKSVLLKQMLEQDGSRAWIVFDAEGRKSLRVSGTDWTDPERVDALILRNGELVHTANTLDELAQKAGWPASRFLATIARFNRDLQDGTDQGFGRFDPQNPPTARVGRPAISPVRVAPFYAIPIYAMTRKSLGGLKVDLECRVFNRQGRPIPNLYAAGEVTGFNGLNGKAGLEGTFLGPSILQGRILGQNLGKIASRHTVSTAPQTLRAFESFKSADAPCQSCHPLTKLMTPPRKGYWHFERVHQLVLNKAWKCQRCHAEMSPFNAMHHKTNAMAQTAACSLCHLGAE